MEEEGEEEEQSSEKREPFQSSCHLGWPQCQVPLMNH